MALAYPLRGQPSYMHKNGLEVTMISADGKDLPKLLAKEICPHIIVPMTRSITPWKDLTALFKLIKIFKKVKPDIVHTETPKAGLLGMMAAWFCGVKIRIHTVAGLPLMVEKGLKLKALEFIEKITYAAATNVWPNSNSLKEFILKHGLADARKLHVVGKGSSNGINVERFTKEKLDPVILEQVKFSFNYNEKYIYLLFVGRLVLDKGIVELVNVFTGLQKTNGLLKLILLGQYERSLDPLPAYIEKKINNNPAIIHVGWTNKVEYYMAFSNYFVFPSYREGFPNVLLEAAAMNLPIVCSRIAGNIDIVTHNETGLIFESQDEQSLKESLSNALNNSAHSREMANNLQQFITTSYKREIFWDTMLKEYKMLLN